MVACLLEDAEGRRVEETYVPAQSIDDDRPPARRRVSQAERELLVQPRVVPREVLHAGVLQQALQLALRAKVLEDLQKGVTLWILQMGTGVSVGAIDWYGNCKTGS